MTRNIAIIRNSYNNIKNVCIIIFVPIILLATNCSYCLSYHLSSEFYIITLKYKCKYKHIKEKYNFSFTILNFFSILEFLLKSFYLLIRQNTVIIIM
jgi:hypothetical protein